MNKWYDSIDDHFDDCFICENHIYDCTCEDEDEDEEVEDLVDLLGQGGEPQQLNLFDEYNPSYDDKRENPLDFKPQPRRKPQPRWNPQPRWESQSRWNPRPRRNPELRVLYFAFGSNMELGQMKKRCPSAREVEGHYSLDGYRLAFCGYSNSWGGGVATIEPFKIGVVLGRLYSMTWDDVRRLDGYEGHPHVYRRSYKTLTDGQSVLTYVKPIKNNRTSPSESYFTTIARGYQQVGYDLEKLVDASLA